MTRKKTYFNVWMIQKARNINKEGVKNYQMGQILLK
jgi:hypothetical protein